MNHWHELKSLTDDPTWHKAEALFKQQGWVFPILGMILFIFLCSHMMHTLFWKLGDFVVTLPRFTDKQSFQINKLFIRHWNGLRVGTPTPAWVEMVLWTALLSLLKQLPSHHNTHCDGYTGGSCGFRSLWQTGGVTDRPLTNHSGYPLWASVGQETCVWRKWSHRTCFHHIELLNQTMFTDRVKGFNRICLRDLHIINKLKMRGDTDPFSFVRKGKPVATRSE